MEVDGSGFAMGAVLMQEQQGEWRPVTHMSKKQYSPAERITIQEDREFYGYYESIKTMETTFSRSGTIQNLDRPSKSHLFPKTFKTLNHQQAGWVQKMQEYDFYLHYLEGKKNTRADTLSRRGEEEKKQDNKDVVILPEEMFR